MSRERVLLAEDLDQTAAEPLLRQIRQLRGTSIDIDASSGRRLGGQCLQVLLAAKMVWTVDGAPFQIEKPSMAFEEACRLMGAAKLLDGALETAQ